METREPCKSCAKNIMSDKFEYPYKPLDFSEYLTTRFPSLIPR